MSIQFQYQCDLCSKQEINTTTYILPSHWTRVYLMVKFHQGLERETEFCICPVCYAPDFSQQDTPKKDTPLTQPSPGMKNIFKKLWKKVLTKQT